MYDDKLSSIAIDHVKQRISTSSPYCYHSVYSSSSTQLSSLRFFHVWNNFFWLSQLKSWCMQKPSCRRHNIYNIRSSHLHTCAYTDRFSGADIRQYRHRVTIFFTKHHYGGNLFKECLKGYRGHDIVFGLGSNSDDKEEFIGQDEEEFIDFYNDDEEEDIDADVEEHNDNFANSKKKESLIGHLISNYTTTPFGWWEDVLVSAKWSHISSEDDELMDEKVGVDVQMEPLSGGQDDDDGDDDHHAFTDFQDEEKTVGPHMTWPRVCN
ncbi:hypothetical protein DFA_05543 [Cavenderia fasciculata]|uniref:Uncharacterized protein n=1 Tax=Cavenderia fasciculata TaxID=261658 RepID=F4PLI9_CACFS|nr:uncharacterized protein DFA_05543 [Cavenderia fasciculata]EGG23411.1 hypothetical protein DFA_05543 [Cavenderia fasciculata]|eukprot:XP_004361262.1 hypothetical protein DFA_05543 [Cavenderia fasciculata]